MAGFATLWGLVCLGAVNQGVAWIVVAAAHFLYAALALVILIANGAEFSRTRV
jgi:hypothetical protein